MWAYALVLGVGIWQKIANAHLVLLPVHTDTVAWSDCNIAIFWYFLKMLSNM